MNYEKLYKEALERAETKLTNDVVIYIFPELKENEESEDEMFETKEEALAYVEQLRERYLNYE